MNFFQKKHMINCGGKLLDLSTPKVMGILNVTPDSFYDGGQYNQMDKIWQQTEKMLQDGAAIIDVGGMSSRPNAETVETEEELKRVIPVIEQLVKEFPDILISIDTVKAKVAQEAVEAGAVMVNDISAGSMDANLIPTIGRLKVPYVLMHMQGKPQTMQHAPTYEDVVIEVIDFCRDKIEVLKTAGVEDIIIDVGFGFGKTLTHNYQLLKHLNDFQLFELPILAGISRKSMIYKALNIEPKEALNGTSVLHVLALQNGANLLRVHDVKKAVEVIDLMHLYHKV